SLSLTGDHEVVAPSADGRRLALVTYVGEPGPATIGPYELITPRSVRVIETTTGKAVLDRFVWGQANDRTCVALDGTGRRLGLILERMSNLPPDKDRKPPAPLGELHLALSLPPVGAPGPLLSACLCQGMLPRRHLMVWDLDTGREELRVPLWET